MGAETATAYVGLGSNLSDPAERVRGALNDLAGLPRTRLRAASRLYRTPPWGVEDQPEFINAVAALETGLAPAELLASLQSLERKAGRERRGEKWGPRVLDLDILLFGDTVREDSRLTLPHPRMHQRAFVLVPLLELEPNIEIPGRGPAADALRKLDVSGVRLLENES